MSAVGPFAIPILAVGAFAATLGWFGYQHMTRGPSAAAAVEVSSKPNAGPASPMPGATEAAGKPSPTPRANAGPNGAAASEAGPVAPAFDVVRVEPTGETVVAGRATPGASVELLLNGTRHSRVIADPSGLFALVPEALPAGSHELVLQVTNGDGSRVRSPQSVTVVVAANRRDAPLVTITAPGQPAVVLSRPEEPASVAGPGGKAAPVEVARRDAGAPATEGAPAAKTRRPVQISSVETEGAGRLLVSGSAAPSSVVRLYLNDTFVAPASAGQDGRVSFAIERGMQPGTYKVRLDDVDPVSGQVRSRAEVPFEMPHQVASAVPAAPREATTGESGRDAAPARVASAGEAGGSAVLPPSDATAPIVVVPEINTAMVSRGDSLWAISKRAYGQGLRFSVIYGANAKQIRDPNLIYPGQLFVLPANNAEAASR